MNKIHKAGLLTVALLSFLGFASVGCADSNEPADKKTSEKPLLNKQPLDKIVAIVNDTVITNNELNLQVSLVQETLNKRHMPLPSESVLRKQVLEHMIDTDLEMQMAKGTGIQVDSHDVDAAIETMAARNHLTVPELRKAVQSQGISWKAYRRNVNKEMTISKLQEKAVGQIIITDQQVDDYLASNAGAIASQRNSAYHLEDILIPLSGNPTSQEVQAAESRAMNVLKKLRAGANFNEVAVAESGGENALEGGDLGFRQLPELPEAFASRVVDMKPGDLAGPIRIANGFHIIKLVAIEGAGSKAAPSKEQVRAFLYQRKYNEAVQNWMMQLRNSTYIKTYL